MFISMYSTTPSTLSAQHTHSFGHTLRLTYERWRAPGIAHERHGCESGAETPGQWLRRLGLGTGLGFCACPSSAAEHLAPLLDHMRVHYIQPCERKQFKVQHAAPRPRRLAQPRKPRKPRNRTKQSGTEAHSPGHQIANSTSRTFACRSACSPNAGFGSVV